MSEAKHEAMPVLVGRPTHVGDVGVSQKWIKMEMMENMPIYDIHGWQIYGCSEESMGKIMMRNKITPQKTQG
jgi:hypothetical protein